VDGISRTLARTVHRHLHPVAEQADDQETP